MSDSDLLTVPEVAEATRHHPNSVRRWIGTGVPVPGRRGRVKLTAERIGGRVFVSRDALAAFRSECNPDAPPAPESPVKAARRAAEARDRVLRMLNGV